MIGRVRLIAIVGVAVVLVLSTPAGYVAVGSGTTVAAADNDDAATVYPGQTVTAMNVSVVSEDEQLIENEISRGSIVKTFGKISYYAYINDETKSDQFDKGDDVVKVIGLTNGKLSQLKVQNFNDSVIYIDDPDEAQNPRSNKYDGLDDIYKVNDVVWSSYITEDGTPYTTFQSSELYLTNKSTQIKYEKKFPIIRSQDEILEETDPILRDGESGILDDVPNDNEHYNDDIGSSEYDSSSDHQYGEPIYETGGDGKVSSGDLRLTEVQVFSGLSDNDINTINLHYLNKARVKSGDGDQGVELSDFSSQPSINEIDPDGSTNSLEGEFGPEDIIVIDTNQNGRYDKSEDIPLQGDPIDGKRYDTSNIGGVWKRGSDSNKEKLIVFDKGNDENVTGDNLLIQSGEIEIGNPYSYDDNAVKMKYWDNDQSNTYTANKESLYLDVGDNSKSTNGVTNEDFRLTHFEVEYEKGSTVSSYEMDAGIGLTDFESDELFLDDNRDGELTNGEPIIKSYDHNLNRDDLIKVQGAFEQSANSFPNKGDQIYLHYNIGEFTGKEPIILIESVFGMSSGEYNTNTLSMGETTELNAFDARKPVFEGYSSSTDYFKDGDEVLRLEWFEESSGSLVDLSESSTLTINQFDPAIKFEHSLGEYEDGETIIEENDGRHDITTYGNSLTALTVSNEGTTPDEAIESIGLRRDGVEIATASTRENGVWTLEPETNADFGPVEGATFEVTATLAADAPVDSTVEMAIADVDDGGVLGDFDQGDQGLYFADGLPVGGIGSGPTYTVADADDIDASGVAYPDPEFASHDTTAIELAFTDALDPATTTAEDFTVETSHGEQRNVTGLDDDDDDERLVLEMESDVVPSTIETVSFQTGALSVASGAVIPERTVDVETGSVTITEAEARQPVVYAGERVAVLANDGENGNANPDETVRIEKDTTGDGNVDDLVRLESTGSGSQVSVFDTNPDDDATYRVTFESEDGSPGETVEFPVQNLSLEVVANRTNTTDVAGPIGATIGARGGNRPVRAALLDLDEENETVLDKAVVDLDTRGNGTVSFPARDANVSIEVTDVGTGQTNRTENITVRKGYPGATFTQQVFEEHRGDVAQVEVRLVDTTNVTLTVGDERVNYRERVSVADTDGDGRVTVSVNTHRAGADAAGTGVAIQKDERHGEETDRIVGVDRAFPPGKGLDDPLETGVYPLKATVDGEVTDLGKLRVKERATSDARTLVAPASVDLDSATDVKNWTTPRETVAVGDQAIVAVNASGLGGFLNESTDLRRGSRAAANNGAYVSITRSNPPPNRPARNLNVSNASTRLDRSGDSLYLVVPSADDTYEIEDGEMFDATFVLNETSPYVGGDGSPDAVERESTETSVAFETPAGRFADLDANETVDLPATANASVGGETNVAPGTEVTVTLTSDDENVTFRKSDTDDVEEDGSFETTVDLEEYPEGTEYTVVASANDDDITEIRTGEIVESSIETDAAIPVTTSGAGGGGSAQSIATSGTQTRVTTTRQPTVAMRTTDDRDGSVGDRAAEFVTRDVPQFITTQATNIVVGLGILAVLYGLLGLRRLTR